MLTIQEYQKQYRQKNKELLSIKQKEYKAKKRQSKLENSDFDLSILSDCEYIKGYENLYMINKNGLIINCPKITRSLYSLKIPDISKGYERVKLYSNGKYKGVFVHQLVALQWIHNPENKPHINHIDGNKRNNSIDNLEWCTPQENITHSIKTGLAGTNSHRKHKTNKSGYIGVCFHKMSNKWRARIINQDKERVCLGYYKDVIEAAKAYDNAVDLFFNGEKPKNF